MTVCTPLRAATSLRCGPLKNRWPISSNTTVRLSLVAPTTPSRRGPCSPSDGTAHHNGLFPKRGPHSQRCAPSKRLVSPKLSAQSWQRPRPNLSLKMTPGPLCCAIAWYRSSKSSILCKKVVPSNVLVGNAGNSVFGVSRFCQDTPFLFMREIVGQFQASHGIVLHILPLIKPTAHAHSHHFFCTIGQKPIFLVVK